MSSQADPSPPRQRIGLRQEANVFLPVAVLALVALCSFALWAHRSALDAVTDEAQSDLVDAAWQGASLLPPDARRAEDLRRALPPELVASLVDEQGRAVARRGDVPPGNLLEPGYASGETPREPRTAGPNAATDERLVAWLPLRNGLVLRIERPVPALAAQWSRWRTLTAVSTFSLAAIATLLVFYLRRLFAPIDSLLRAARQLDQEEAAGRPGEPPIDELDDLVHRFQQAIAQHQANLGARDPSADAEGGSELQAEAAALEQTFSRLESGMALLDLDGRFLALNGVGQRILGLTDVEMPLPMERALEAHDELRRTLLDAIDSEEVLRRREFTLFSPSSSEAGEAGARDEIFVGLSFSPLQREDGATRGWILLFADLSRARAEATRIQMSTSLSQLAELTAGFAHELRNGLASVQGFASLLGKVHLPDDSARHDFDELQREVDQLHRLVEDFLDFARPGQSRLGEVDLFRLAHRAAGDPALGGAAIRARARGEGPWVVRGDEHLLHRLVRNLLLNAVRAQRRQASSETIELRVSREIPPGADPRLQLEVLDRGDGLSEAALDSLFVPFATHAEGGSGLGLAIAKRIADLHHAELHLGNRRDGGVRARLRFSTTFSTLGSSEETAALPVLEPDSDDG